MEDAIRTARFEIRAATEADHEDLCELSRYLDTVNLPEDPAALKGLLQRSERSFSGAVSDPRYREHVFVLRDRTTGHALGTSQVLGQLGRRDAPYVYYDVRSDERYSATLDRYFVHRVLKIGYSYDGPTEIGGLVVHPEHRRTPWRLGRAISYVRFLWIAMHRADMRNTVLAELLPPLAPDGTSHLWEAVGRRFTGLTYREADRLSQDNKEFIRGLFPDGDIYVSLLPDDARSVVGEVGEQTQGVEKMLRRIGFRYVDRVDPFDGGPHFMACTDEVGLVRDATRREVRVGTPPPHGEDGLVANEFAERPYFVAVPWKIEPEREVVGLSPEAAATLRVSDGDAVWTVPF